MDKYLETFRAAVGDAKGAATEMRTLDQISEKFGGYVREFSLRQTTLWAWKPARANDWRF